MDPQGYLQASAEEIAAGDGGRRLPGWKRSCQIVQGFDPTGVAARDLKECLLVQVKVLGIDDPLVMADHQPAN